MFLICLVMPWSAAGQQPEIAAMVAFTEGPTVDREGNVYFTDIINQRIMKLSTASIATAMSGQQALAVVGPMAQFARGRSGT